MTRVPLPSRRRVPGDAHAAASALDEHADAVRLPSRFVFVMVRERVEFYIGVVSDLLGSGRC